MEPLAQLPVALEPIPVPGAVMRQATAFLVLPACTVLGLVLLPRLVYVPPDITVVLGRPLPTLSAESALLATVAPLAHLLLLSALMAAIKTVCKWTLVLIVPLVTIAKTTPLPQQSALLVTTALPCQELQLGVPMALTVTLLVW